MGWGRLDDRFDDNRKIVALMGEENGLAAIGLWTVCLTWAHRNTRGKPGRIPGFLPPGILRRFGGGAGRHLADLLVLHGLWEFAENEGWLIHDFDKYLSPMEIVRPPEFCHICHAELPPGRAGRRFCSHACRQADYRQRNVSAGREVSSPKVIDIQSNVGKKVTDNVTDKSVTVTPRDISSDSYVTDNFPELSQPQLSQGAPRDSYVTDSVTDNVTDNQVNVTTVTPRDTLRSEESQTLIHAIARARPEPEPERTTTNLAKASPEPELFDTPKIPKTRQRVVDDPDFAAFWSAYPRPVGKGGARTAWAKAIKKVDPGVIIEAAQRYRGNPRRPQDLQYVPHPARWLNDGRWEDEDVPPPQDSHDDWWDH